jgi:hypothetical protein
MKHAFGVSAMLFVNINDQVQVIALVTIRMHSRLYLMFYLLESAISVNRDGCLPDLVAAH